MSQYRPEILIIDDRMESVALLLRYFQGQPVDVMVALNGKDGIRKAIAGQPNLILLDITMPQLDGFEVCRMLKAHAQTMHIPVLFLSALNTLEDKLTGFAAGAVDYIAKPFSSEEVMARVYVHFKMPIRETPINLLDQESRSITSLNEVHSDGRDSRIMAAALGILQNPNYAWQGVETLASKVGVIEKRLTDLFRKQFGMTVSEYQISHRLETARGKLSPGTMQIQRIAEEAGYQNASDFSRAFRQRYGIGPRDYRRAGTTPNKKI